MLKIGEVAAIIGCSVETIRHYETLGLIKPAGRSATGQRLFNMRDVDTLRFIKAFRRIDISLNDIAEAISALNDDSFCIKVEAIAAKYARILEEKRQELADCETALNNMRQKCMNCGKVKPFVKETCDVASEK